jgi:DNA polymerase-3 subunit delta
MQHAFEFLESRGTRTSPFVVLFGDERFLMQLVRRKLREIVLGDDSTPHTRLEGETAAWCDVADELATVSLFSQDRPRLVVVAEADDFVSKFRVQLERYLERPRSTGILVLEVETWASNTRLYKAVEQSAQAVDCRLPQAAGQRNAVDEGRLMKWLVQRASEAHAVILDGPAARLLWELAGPDLGIVDQDLAKLALFATPKQKVTRELVHEVVGGWRAKSVWETASAAASGDAAEALRQLDRALQSGEHPVGLLAQLSWSLRRFAVATRIYERAERRGQRLALRDALLQAGFRNWPANALAEAEQQLKQIGRDRAGQILKWLLDADLALKGSHSSPPQARFVLEQLFLRLAKRTAKARPSGAVSV